MKENYLRNVRIAKKVKAIEVAKHLGVSTAFISRVEHGTKDMSFSLAIEIADFLDVSLDEIAGRNITAPINEAEHRTNLK